MTGRNRGRGEAGVVAASAVLVLVFLVFGVAALPAAASIGGATAAEPLAERVVIVVMSGVSWGDLELAQAAGVRRVFESGWAANLNCAIRELPRTTGRTMVTLGAASGADDGGQAGQAFMVDEPYENGRALEAYVRRAHRLPGTSRVLHLGVAAIGRANAGSLYPVRPGLMGSTVSLAGKRTAVFGNSDVGLDGPGDGPHREAAVIAMDEEGRVDFGTVGAETLIPDTEMAYGVRTNIGLVLNRYSALPRDVGLVVIDLGDTERASRHGRSSSAAARRFLRGRAMARASEFLTRFVEMAGEEAAIIVLSPTADPTGRSTPEPTPFVMLVPGERPGLATSGSTRRAGLVSGHDLVRTVSYVLAGADEVPSDVPGRPITRAGGSLTPPLESLARASERSADITEARPPVLWAWFVGQVIGLVLAVFLLRSEAEDENASRLTEALLLWCVTVPLSGLLIGLMPDAMVSPVGVAVFCLASAAAVAAALALSPLGSSRQLLIVLAALVGIVVLDQSAGPFGASRVAADTIFGYSLIDGGRYYGIGNEAWSLLFAAGALAAGLLLDADRVEWARRRWAAAAAVVALCLLVGVPVLGANVGGFISCAAGAAVMWLGWDGKRPTWRLALIAGAALVGGLVLLAAVDLIRPGQQATHLAVAARQVGSEGLAAAWDMARRKLALNLSIFQRAPLALLVLPLLLFLVVERRRPAGHAAAFLSDRPRLSTALAGVFAAGVVGAVANDTGVTIPALMLGVALPAVLMLMLAARRRRREALDL